jgi:transposase
MHDLATLSREQLIDLLYERDARLVDKDAQLQNRNAELQDKDVELETYRQQLREQDIALQTKALTIEELEQDRDTWKLAYNKLLQDRFHQRSERYLDNPDQLRIDFGDTPEAADAALGLADAIEDAAETIGPYQRRKPRKRRDESLPDHLDRYEVVAPMPDALKFCDLHGERTLLPRSMWDVIESLEFQRPVLIVRRTLYPKYVCEGQPLCGIASPPRPTGLVEGDKYDTSIAAEIITGKFSYHLPLYRQQDYFGSCGWTPSRGTQNNLLSQSYFVVQPLLDFFKRKVQSDVIVGCDDTSVTLLYPKTLPAFDLDDPRQRRMHEVFAKALAERQPSIQAKMWAYRGMTIPLNVFDFTVSRHRDGPELFFQDYVGTLLGDCWNGFEAIVIASDGRIARAACNTHARRKFRQSTSYPDDAAVWLRWYRQLYDIEDRGKMLSPEERLALRQSEAQPIWQAMQGWLDEVRLRTSNVILPKSDFAKALQYVRNHFTELQLYLSDPLLPIDNNLTEQLMKQVAIGRKNWLFAGSVSGGERSAGFLTLASSALRNDLDVWQYIKDVLDQLLGGSTDYESLLPWNWAQTHPDAIRHYRVEERRDRATRQQARRANRRTPK